MNASNKNILIVGADDNRLDIHNEALGGWTVHLAHDLRMARHELSRHPSIDVVAIPVDSFGHHEAFREHCRSRYPNLAYLLIQHEISEDPESPNRTTLPPFPSPDVLRAALENITNSSVTPGQEPGGEAPGDSAAREIRFQQDWVKVVTHDIRSPLTLINSYATMLLRDGFDNEAQARLIVERILNSGQWMMALVDNILDLAFPSLSVSIHPSFYSSSLCCSPSGEE